MPDPTPADEKKVMIRKVIPPSENFINLFPRTVNGSSRSERMEKTANNQVGSMDFNFNGSFGGSGNVYKGPSNRFYSPDMTSSSMFLPKDIRNKNLWRRWMSVHDPLIGAVMEYYTEMPWSRAELNIDDPFIAKVYMDAMEDSQFFARCQHIDQEYLKIGEAIINFNFNDSKGYIDYIVIQNPNFIEIKGSPLIGDQPDIFLVPDQELKKVITSTDPRIREKKKLIDRRIVEAVMWGRNIQLPPEYTLHIARRENPTDLRGTSIIDRLFKTYMLEDKITEGVLATVDNHMFPIKLWKLGDAATHWIPPESHSKALAEMLQQQQFDPNFALIYHFGIEY